jgi:uncharacterized membrane protein YfcA
MDWRIALVIGLTGAVGTRLGIWVNTLISRQVFGILLAVLLGGLGIVILIRERHELTPLITVGNAGSKGEITVLAAIGVFIGTCSGLFGIGGAALTVPFLLLVGVSLLTALAVTQVIVVFLSAFTAAGYVVAGAVHSPLVFFIGTIYTAGYIAGWYLAHQVDTDRLTIHSDARCLVLRRSLLPERSSCNPHPQNGNSLGYLEALRTL